MNGPPPGELLAVHPEQVAEHARSFPDAGAYTVIRTEPDGGKPSPVYALAPGVRAVLVVADRFGIAPPPSDLTPDRHKPGE